MTDLLTPEKVRDIQFTGAEAGGPVEDASWSYAQLDRLCHDYLTLWERVKHLEKTIDILDKTRGLKRA